MKKILFLFFAFFFSVNTVLAIDFDKFDVNDINAVRNATKYYQQEYKHKRGSKEAEEDYYKYSKFASKFEDVQRKMKNLQDYPINNSVKKQLKIYFKQYYQYGLIVQFDEGEFILVLSNQYLSKNFGPYLSKPYQELLKFHSSDKRTTYDCRYIVPKSYLKKQIKFYKNFGKKYPEFYTEDELSQIIQSLEDDIKHYPNIIY